MPLEHFVNLDCSMSRGGKCSVVLPLQSPLGTVAGLSYLREDTWPAVFLCLRHGRACICSDEHRDQRIRTTSLSLLPLWQIVCECGHEGCGRSHTSYTDKARDWATLAKLILVAPPSIRCGDHVLIWREELMRGTAYPHGPDHSMS
jgi:hypothetical protein